MDKVQINTGDEYLEILQRFISEFMQINPIFKHLKLTDEQMDILLESEIMPKFKEIYDVSLTAKKQASQSKQP